MTTKNKSSITFPLTIVIIVVIIAVVWWSSADPLGTRGGKLPFQKGATDNETVTPIPLSSEIAALVADKANLTEIYTDTTFPFSFQYPRGFTASSLLAEDSYTVVVQNTAERSGIQILITPFPDTDNTLTKERIEADIPGILVKDPQLVTLGANSGQGLAFLSDNPAFGESREVWFIYKGQLYQVTTYSTQDALLQAIMNTWQFVAGR